MDVYLCDYDDRRQQGAPRHTLCYTEHRAIRGQARYLSHSPRERERQPPPVFGGRLSPWYMPDKARDRVEPRKFPWGLKPAKAHYVRQSLVLEIAHQIDRQQSVNQGAKHFAAPCRHRYKLRDQTHTLYPWANSPHQKQHNPSWSRYSLSLISKPNASGSTYASRPDA